MGIRTIVSVLGIEQSDPAANMGTNINNILPDAPPRWQRKASGAFAGALEYSQSGPAGCGGILSWNLAPPIDGNGNVLTHFKLEWDRYIDALNFDQAWRLEMDAKIVTNPAATGNTITNNVGDASSQLNKDKGWMFQIDDKTPLWTDTPILAPPVPDAWIHYCMTGSIAPDPVAPTLSVESFLAHLVGSPAPDPQLVPKALQGVAYITSKGWFSGTKGGVKIQAQAEQQFAGSFEMVLWHVNFYASDQPFV